MTTVRRPASTEFPIDDLESIGEMLAWLARRNKISVHALTSLSGNVSSSLTGYATGSRRSNDLNAGPVLRILKQVGYEMVTRPKGGEKGTVIRRERANPLMVVGIDGGRLEICWDELDDIPVLLNTLALATDQTVSGMVKASGINSTSLVSQAMGTSDHKDVRLRGLLRLIDQTDFELAVRQITQVRREANIALIKAYRS